MRMVKLVLTWILSLSFLWPASVKPYEHNGLLLDCARKYYSIEWIEQMIDHLARNNGNELILHFSENEGCRIESEQYPWLTDRMNGVYSQEEIIRLGQYARKRGIELIPSFDAPGHLQYVLAQYKEQYGESIAMDCSEKCLDISNEKGVAFIRSLYEEYGKLFLKAGSTQFDLGGDEVFPDHVWKKAGSWQTMIEKKKHDDRLSAYDAFVDFINENNNFMKSLGYTSYRMFNDQLRKGHIPLDTDIDIAYWTIKGDLPANNKVLNYLNFYLYYILDPDLSYMGGDPGSIEREWTPVFFLNKKIDESRISGSAYCIWSDIPDTQTEQEVMQGVLPNLEAWGHKCTTRNKN